MAEGQRTALVVGGAGYIGSNCCKLLAQKGFLPVTYDNMVYGHPEVVKWGPLEIGDIADGARLDEVMKRYRPEAVLHFAAFINVGESVGKPGKYYRNNVCGTISLLDAMVRNGIGRIVFSSTCATYGDPQWIPLTEDHPQAPLNPYGWSKFMVETILDDYETAHGIRSAALRYFNAAGADPEAETGEDHSPETHLIPIVLDAAMGRREEVAVFGDDYDTKDGTCVRDYIHVVDLGDAHLRALDHLAAGKESLRLNLGNGAGYTVMETIELAEQVVGKPIRRRMAERRPGDAPKLIGDASRARRILGWNPRYGDLATIIEHAWRWHRKRFG
ncbi:MAG: UDP-glucose 4-epimerase [candidate division BRC1 bacterium ADurb.BinA364]|nr:MAG: UDP-glucose 4-epimerase [candidate division BRC1 bacterium ADurb.BinA364]